MNMEATKRTLHPERFWNPYLAGVALGLVLLASFLVMGHGLGASGAANRVGVGTLHALAPLHVESNAYLSHSVANGAHPLDHWLVFEVIGVFLGGAVASFLAGRSKGEVVRGPRIGSWSRLGLAFAGGIIMGVAARLARGCTSGQALSGGALLSVGSWVFMLAIFAGGYATAHFVRREWT